MSENDDECPECSNMSSCCGYGEDSALAAAQERIAQLEQERDRWQLRFAGNDRLMLKAQERIRVLEAVLRDVLYAFDKDNRKLVAAFDAARAALGKEGDVSRGDDGLRGASRGVLGRPSNLRADAEGEDAERLGAGVAQEGGVMDDEWTKKAHELNEWFWDGEDGGVTTKEWLGRLAGEMRQAAETARAAEREAILVALADCLPAGTLTKCIRAIRALAKEPG